MRVPFGNRPSLSLPFETSAIESETEIFIITEDSYFWILHYGISAVV